MTMMPRTGATEPTDTTQIVLQIANRLTWHYRTGTRAIPECEAFVTPSRLCESRDHHLERIAAGSDRPPTQNGQRDAVMRHRDTSMWCSTMEHDNAT